MPRASSGSFFDPKSRSTTARTMSSSTGPTSMAQGYREWGGVLAAESPTEPAPHVAVLVEPFDREPAVGSGGDGHTFGHGAPDRYTGLQPHGDGVLVVAGEGAR